MVVNIGIIGLGTVGSGVIETIEKNQVIFFKKYKIKFKIAGITAKNKNKKRSFDIKKYKWFKNPIDLAKSSEIDIVVELIGGANGIALDVAKTALTNKKNLVTANKAMIAIHGYQLKRLANKYSVNLNFEASVAGGIPIIRTLENSLLSDKITKVYGVLNGTCNYILTQMNVKNLSFDQALKSAQKLGYAESNPFDDVSGTDTAYKLLILSNLVFGLNVKLKDIYLEGITDIESIDIEMANKLGYSILLLGISKIKKNVVEYRVHPSLVSQNSVISKVKNELNTVVLDCHLADKITLIGKGAGKKPTASAVLSDIIDSYKKEKRGLVSNNKNNKKPLKVANIKDRKGKFYVRMGVMDTPGVLADITAFFKRNKISISTMFQLEKKISNYVQLIFVTHQIIEKQLILSIKKIEKLDKVKTKIKIIRIEESL
jgi:homoserine dehydrogenase